MMAASSATPPLARAIADAALWREAKGGSGMEELIAAAVIALIDRPSSEIPALPVVPYGRQAPDGLPWWAIDSHVPLGERALGRVARRHGMSTWALGWLQFNHSSILVGPAEEPARWREEALELDARAGGWRSHAEGERLWRSLEREVQAEIEAELDRSFPTVRRIGR
jgi:hypothetical protein